MALPQTEEQQGVLEPENRQEQTTESTSDSALPAMRLDVYDRPIEHRSPARPGIDATVLRFCDTQSTRLLAKAWMFRRTGYSTAYISSSNLSKSALIDGVEWNVRLLEVTSPDLLEKFDATFDSYWAESGVRGLRPRQRRQAAGSRVGRSVNRRVSMPGIRWWRSSRRSDASRRASSTSIANWAGKFCCS